jgi:hypothetical protein
MMVVAALAWITLSTSKLLGQEVLHPGRPACSIPARCEISFRKHTLDLGPSETAAMADVNRDGRFDVVSGEYWYEQLPRATRRPGPRWAQHKFRDLGYTAFYLEDLSDLAIDVNGDGDLDITVGGKSGLFIFENLTTSR